MPQLALYKHPGPYEIHGDKFDYIAIHPSDLEEALSNGWYRTTTEALAASNTEAVLSNNGESAGIVRVDESDLHALSSPNPDDCYRLKSTGELVAWDSGRKEFRTLAFHDPACPEFLDDLTIDFRKPVDLKTLGIKINGQHAITGNEIIGSTSATLSADSGLQVRETKTHGWNSVLAFHALGAKVDSGKSLSFIVRANGGMNNMLGLMGLHNDVETASPYQAYSHLMPAIYYRTTSSGQIYRPYYGVDDMGGEVTSTTFKDSANKTATLSNMNGKWWRADIQAMGIEGARIAVTEVSPSDNTSELFGQDVELGQKLTATIAAKRGNSSRYSCFAFAGNQFNSGFDLMAVSIS